VQGAEEEGDNKLQVGILFDSGANYINVETVHNSTVGHLGVEKSAQRIERLLDDDYIYKETREILMAEIEAARKLKDMDKVRMLEASIGNEEDAKAALKKIDAQETFNQSIEKLKSMQV
jgi:hypothetical protein